jgi:hypothetical protein
MVWYRGNEKARHAAGWYGLMGILETIAFVTILTAEFLPTKLGIKFRATPFTLNHIITPCFMASCFMA